MPSMMVNRLNTFGFGFFSFSYTSFFSHFHILVFSYYLSARQHWVFVEQLLSSLALFEFSSRVACALHPERYVLAFSQFPFSYFFTFLLLSFSSSSNDRALQACGVLGQAARTFCSVYNRCSLACVYYQSIVWSYQACVPPQGPLRETVLYST